MPLNERDTSSLPAAVSSVCILMSINYALNELSNSAMQLMCVCLPLRSKGRLTGPLKINGEEIQLVERKGRDFEAVVFIIHLA